MPREGHFKPCSECPFRVDAMPGWLGASNPIDFVEHCLGQQDMKHALPCHAAIDYEREDWKIYQYPAVAVCAGSLIFLNNYMKLPRGDIALSIGRYGTSDAVFAGPTEFLRHHMDEPDAEWLNIGGRVVRV